LDIGFSRFWGYTSAIPWAQEKEIMGELKSIHDVAALVGIDRKTSEEIVAEVKANQKLLDGCLRHDFSICLDRRTKQPIANPTDLQHFGAYWKCSRCGGWVPSIDRRWYNLGLQHGLRIGREEV
jgi:hypothetical protein